MPEPTSAAGPPSRPGSVTPPDTVSVEELEAAIARAVLGIPGVVRLEPTLRTAGLRGLVRRHPTDGIQLVSRDERTGADINVATSSDHQARTVAEQIERCVTELLAAAGVRRGTVTVNVLTIDPGRDGR